MSKRRVLIIASLNLKIIGSIETRALLGKQNINALKYNGTLNHLSLNVNIITYLVPECSLLELAMTTLTDSKIEAHILLKKRCAV